MSHGQIGDFMDMLSTIYDGDDISSSVTSEKSVTIKSDENDIFVNSEENTRISDYDNNENEKNDDDDDDHDDASLQLTDIFNQQPDDEKYRFFSLTNIINFSFFQENKLISSKILPIIKKIFLEEHELFFKKLFLFDVSDFMVVVFSHYKKMINSYNVNSGFSNRSRHYFLDIDKSDHESCTISLSKSRECIIETLYNDLCCYCNDFNVNDTISIFDFLLILISDLSTMDSELLNSLQINQNNKRYGKFDLKNFTVYTFWETYSVCYKKMLVSDENLYDEVCELVNRIRTRNFFDVHHLLRTSNNVLGLSKMNSSFKSIENENLDIFINSKNSVFKSNENSNNHHKQIKPKPENLEIKNSGEIRSSGDKLSFSEQLKKNNWLWETFKTLNSCLDNNSNYLNDGRISKRKGTFDDTERKYTKTIILRKKPFVKGSRFEGYQNFLVHKWIHKKFIAGTPGSIKSFVQSTTTIKFLDIINSKFQYKYWNSNEYIEAYKTFRSLVSVMWFRIPFCYRRAILLSEQNMKRFKHFDRFKLVTFFYMCIFRQISQLIISEHEQNNQDQNDKIRITSIFSVQQISQFLFTFLEEISTGKNLVSGMSIMDLFGLKSKNDKSGSIILTESSELKDCEYGEKQFKSIKVNIEDLVSKDKTEKSFIYSNCSSMADLRQDGTTSGFAVDSTTIICPFSEKNKSKSLDSIDKEFKLFISAPKCIIRDIEDLGSNVKREIQREYYTDEIDDTVSGGLNTQKTKEIFSKQIFSAKTMEQVYGSCYSLCQNCNNNDSKQTGTLFFSNPQDKFLKTIFRGDTKDV